MDFDEPQAIYLQIAEYILEKIITNEWSQTERIPSVRETAKILKVNVNTVMRSYSFLQEKNIIINQRGIGYFVTDNARELAFDWKRNEFKTIILPKVFNQAKILNFSHNEITSLYRDFLEKEPYQ